MKTFLPQVDIDQGMLIEALKNDRTQNIFQEEFRWNSEHFAHFRTLLVGLTD